MIDAASEPRTSGRLPDYRADRHGSGGRTANRGGGMSPMLEITLLEKTGGILTKKIKLDDTGKLVSNGSACTMSTGTAHRLRLNDLSDLASQIHNLTKNQAIALGSLDTALPDQVQVVTKWALDQKNGHAAPDMIARTGGHISYRQDQPTLALLDFDTKGMPAAVADRIRQAGGLWRALVSVLPELAGAARVERNSTSSCIRRTDTGFGRRACLCHGERRWRR
jgi:hypothetical protein